MTKRQPKSGRGSGKDAERSARFRVRTLTIARREIRCREAGKGETVVLIDPAGEESPLAQLLSDAFHVVALETPSDDAAENTAASLAQTLALTFDQAADALGLAHYVLIAAASEAPLALWQAIEARDRVDALILVAPRGLALAPATDHGAASDHELESRLQDIKAPTLVLLGTDDQAVPREAARAYAQRIATSYVVLIYDAGIALAEQRPEAVISAVRDFIEQREKFVVNRASTAINP